MMIKVYVSRLTRTLRSATIKPSHAVPRSLARNWFVLVHVLAILTTLAVQGSYDRDIRFWEAWSGICSRTISRSDSEGVRF